MWRHQMLSLLYFRLGMKNTLVPSFGLIFILQLSTRYSCTLKTEVGNLFTDMCCIDY